MKGFIVNHTYRKNEDSAQVYLFGRLENDESFLAVFDYKPYFYIKESDLKKAKSLAQFDDEKTSLKNLDDEKVVKIILKLPTHIQGLRKEFENNNIQCFEADIRFVMRFLIDHDIISSLDIEGAYEKNDRIDRIYYNPKIKHADYNPTNLKVLSIDIETDRHANSMYCVSLVTKDSKEGIIVSDKEIKHALAVPHEKALLEEFKKKLLEYDPDIIVGWNLIDFDLKVLKKKFDQYKIPFDFGRTGEESKLRIESEYFKDSTADLMGRTVLDGIHLLRSSFIKLEDYKLGTAAEEILGEKKDIGDDHKAAEIEESFVNNPQKLIDYNIKDSWLVLEILKKKKLIELTIWRSLLTGMEMERVKASIASFDSLYLRELKRMGYVAKSSSYEESDTRITGGFVLESKPGIYDYILVLDFKSLYPSIIRTFNIDPYSYVKDHKGDDLIKLVNGATFKNQEGILPSIIKRLWHQRDLAKKQKDDIASYAIKTIMNSFFGVLANPTCRFYSLEMANGITHSGQYLIKLTIQKVKEQGYDVIYGDTDSIFVNSGAKNYEEASKIGKHIQKHVNTFLTEMIKETYKRESFMEIQFEKVFKVFMMPKVRGGEAGSKKRYAGLVIKEEGGKEEMSFTGLEFVRRDWTEVSKDFQLGILDRVFHKKEVAEFVKHFVRDLKKGKFDDKLVYRKSLRKGVDDYTKTTPPHVKAARKMETIDSNIIAYIQTVNGPEPVNDKKSAIDYDHYIEKQLKPIADSVLGFFGQNFDDIIKGDTQKSLFNF